MSTTIQTITIPAANAIYPHETTQLSAIALALVGFAESVRLGPAAAAQRRDLKACASKARFHVGSGGSACTARRRRTWYQRARERLAGFAFALLDLQQGAQIAAEDFDLGRALARRAKTLLDAQLAALATVSAEDQDDVSKLDDLLIAADRSVAAGSVGAGAVDPSVESATMVAVDGRARHSARAKVASTPKPKEIMVGDGRGSQSLQPARPRDQHATPA